MLRPLRFDYADYPIYHRRQPGGAIWGIPVEGIRSAGSGVMASFSMDVSPYRAEVDGWWATCWSPTIKWFYGPISLVIVGIVVALNFEGGVKWLEEYFSAFTTRGTSGV